MCPLFLHLYLQPFFSALGQWIQVTIVQIPREPAQALVTRGAAKTGRVYRLFVQRCLCTLSRRDGDLQAPLPDF